MGSNTWHPLGATCHTPPADAASRNMHPAFSYKINILQPISTRFLIFPHVATDCTTWHLLAITRKTRPHTHTHARVYSGGRNGHHPASDGNSQSSENLHKPRREHLSTDFNGFPWLSMNINRFLSLSIQIHRWNQTRGSGKTAASACYCMLLPCPPPPAFPIG